MDLVSTLFSENFVEKICKADNEVVAHFIELLNISSEYIKKEGNFDAFNETIFIFILKPLQCFFS